MVTAATYSSTPETTNANRSSRILLGPCTDLLRDVLRQRVPPANFHHVILRNRSNLPRLTQPQRDLILPRTGHYTGDYSDMDISLLYLLLRNICNIQPHSLGWGINPDVHDSSLSASIDRIREARNTVIHSSSTILSQHDFKSILSEIKMAVISVDSYLNNNNRYEKAVDFLLTETMDPEQQQYIEQIRKQVEEEKMTKERIRQLEGQQEFIQKQQSVLTDNVRIQGNKIESLETEIQIIRTGQESYTRDVDDIKQQFQQTCEISGCQEYMQRQQSALTENVRTQGDKIGSMETEIQKLNIGQKRTTGDKDDIKQQFQQTSEISGRQECMQRQQNTLTENVRTQGDKIESLKTEIQKLNTGQQRTTREVDDIKQKFLQNSKVSDAETDIKRLKEITVEKNYNDTREIPLSPFQDDGDILPIEQLFSSIVIKEDYKEKCERRKLQAQEKEKEEEEKEEENKLVKTPKDLLTKYGKPVRRIFMLGKAAHGKTMYCLWLLKLWCNTQQPSRLGPLNEWETALIQFDFVFHLPLRHVDPSRANVIDMICLDILENDAYLHTTAQHVLSSNKYRCFIIIDGLDEWKPDQATLYKLKHKGIPNIDNLSNCVLFFTMRPWRFSDVAKIVRCNDKVVEILGLNYKGFENVLKKILVYYYKLEVDTAEYNAKYKELIKKVENDSIRSFLKIPLLALVCVQIWYEEEQTGDSMTSFYTAMINMLIGRAQSKHANQNLGNERINITLPKILSSKKNIRSYWNMLFKLGKVAYEGLLLRDTLVFEKDELEKEIGDRELQFAFDVGLISQRNVHSVLVKKVSVQFFHKSVQEFLAAFFIVTEERFHNKFFEKLYHIEDVFQSSEVILFICGMCPLLGSAISKHVVSVTDRDPDICLYRKWPSQNISAGVKLYKEQLRWYKEFKYSQTDSPEIFHVSDVCQFCSNSVYSPVLYDAIYHIQFNLVF